MGDATVNGDMPSSSFLSHFTSYPVVSDTISTFSSNPYGKKSIDITNATYAKFVKPTLPYFQTPASYAAPYVAKVDQLGDSLLTKVDENIPIVKSETAEIKDTVLDFAGLPKKKAGETKDWIFSTYGDEYKKCGGDGYLAGGKAMITTPLVLGSNVLTWVSSFLSKKTAEAKEVAKEKSGN